MPHDPSEEHISAEEQFRRLMGTSEEDLPDVPDPAPDMLRPVGQPEETSPPQQEARGEVQFEEDEETDKRDVQEKILEKLTQIQVTLMSVEDLLEQAVGGD